MQERLVSQQTAANKPVGKIRFHLKQQPREGNVLRTAKVTFSIQSDGPPIYFTGTIAKEVRSGWVTLEIPPLEQWEESVRWLTPAQRERIESPEFFQLLQREIPNRLRQLRLPASS